MDAAGRAVEEPDARIRCRLCRRCARSSTRCRRRATRDQVFGERGAGGFAGWTSGKSTLDTRSGVTGWVLHDIRRSVATGMANLNVQPHIIEEVLGHSGGHKSGVAGIYNRATYAAAVRAALGVWHDHVRAIVAGGERKVLPFATP